MYSGTPPRPSSQEAPPSREAPLPLAPNPPERRRHTTGYTTTGGLHHHHASQAVLLESSDVEVMQHAAASYPPVQSARRPAPGGLPLPVRSSNPATSSPPVKRDSRHVLPAVARNWFASVVGTAAALLDPMTMSSSAESSVRAKAPAAGDSPTTRDVTGNVCREVANADGPTAKAETLIAHAYEAAQAFGSAVDALPRGEFMESALTTLLALVIESHERERSSKTRRVSDPSPATDAASVLSALSETASPRRRAALSAFAAVSRHSMRSRRQTPRGGNAAFSSPGTTADQTSSPLRRDKVTSLGETLSLLPPLFQDDDVASVKSVDGAPSHTDQSQQSSLQRHRNSDVPATAGALAAAMHTKFGTPPVVPEVSETESAASVPTSQLPPLQETHHADVHDSVEDGLPELNQYVLLESLGRGTQGEVYLAMDTAKNELRAVKAVPRPAQVAAGRPMNAAKRARWEALLREVGIMKRCRHRHVVSLYEVIDDPEQDTMYLVMQYVEHGPLATLLGDGRVSGTISAGTLATYGRQICAGLEYLHRHGVIHRDIKPENILVGQNEQVYLADFGMSEAFEGKGAEHRVTGTRGTAAFLAPELLREIVAQESPGSPVVVSDPTLVGSSGAAVDGKAVDVWALGITFYVLLYGHLPWAFEDARELFEAIQRHPIELRPIDPPLTASSSHFGTSAPPSVPVSLPHLFEGLPTTPTAATQPFKRRSFLSPSTASITPQVASAVDLTAPRGGGGVHGLLPIACLPGPEIDVRAATADLAQDVVSAEGESKGDGSSNGPSNENTEAPRLPRQSLSRRRRSCTSSSAPTATNSPRSMLDQQEASSPNMVMPMPHAAAAVTSGMLGTSVFLDSFIDDGTTAGLDTSWGSPSALQRSGLIASSVKSLVAEDARVVQHRVWHRESSAHSVWSSSVDEAWRRVLVGMLQRDPAQRLKIDAVRRQIAKIQELYVDQGRGGDPTTAAPDAVDANAVSTVLTAIRR